MIDRICPSVGKKEDLLSYYFNGDYSVVSGILWTTCFASIGHLIQGYDKFEGKRNIEGILNKHGVLLNNKFIAGIFFGCNFMGKDLKIYGLYDEYLTFNKKTWNNVDTESVFIKITDSFTNKKSEVIAHEIHKDIKKYLQIYL